MSDSEEPLQEDALVVDQSVIQHVQTLLNHIEEEGGEYRQGREAVERLQQCIEHTISSSDVPVMEQIRSIREALERVETKVATMSEESLHIVSSSVADTQQSSDKWTLWWYQVLQRQCSGQYTMSEVSSTLLLERNFMM